MSVQDEDPDATFAAIMEGVVLEEPTDVVDYTKCSDVELSLAKSELREELFNMGELHNPNAGGHAGDLHAKLYAVNTIIKRRWPQLPNEEEEGDEH